MPKPHAKMLEALEELIDEYLAFQRNRPDLPQGKLIDLSEEELEQNLDPKPAPGAPKPATPAPPAAVFGNRRVESGRNRPSGVQRKLSENSGEIFTSLGCSPMTTC